MSKLPFMLLWIPFLIIYPVLIVAGLIVVPLALLTQHLTLDEPDYKHWPSAFWLWGNDEENVPEWWFVRANQEWHIKPWPRFWWYAIRNPVNNARFLFNDTTPDQLHVETNWQDGWSMEAPQMLRIGQGMAYRWVRHGWKAGYRRVWLNGADKYSEFWIGWKLGSPVPGLGFTFQYRRKRLIGT